jgi:hypothetical protein
MNSSVASWPSAAFADVALVLMTMPSRHGQRAAGLELGHPLDLDEAHAARADRRTEPRLVAEDGISIPAPARPRRGPCPWHLDLAVVDVTRRAQTWRSSVVLVHRRRREDPLERRLAVEGQRPRSMCAWNSSRNLST